MLGRSPLQSSIPCGVSLFTSVRTIIEAGPIDVLRESCCVLVHRGTTATLLYQDCKGSCLHLNSRAVLLTFL